MALANTRLSGIWPLKRRTEGARYMCKHRPHFKICQNLFIKLLDEVQCCFRKTTQSIKLLVQKLLILQFSDTVIA